ncbi:hypothetical protein [Gaetbulibacter sp. S0825]|uniref:hypothetical protein n=1 Tax=Gaetbulibacter sp. S0825 TaxID=2720084 RepID=UPI001430A460|nr:hypothetical protein [Gaetbulibacter sp. S0825]
MRFSVILVLMLLFFSCNEEFKVEDKLSLEHKLSGKWIAKAFDGELHETWKLDSDGWMLQEGYYIESSDTSYSARTRIEKVNNEIILFSVIKNSTPKIFQSKEHNESKMVFENMDYKNPYQVVYEFIDDNNYRRTIKGFESDSLVTYVFDFIKRN